MLFFLEWRRITETEHEVKHRAWGEQDLSVEPYSGMPAVALLRWTVARDCICQSRAWGRAACCQEVWPLRRLAQLSALLVRGPENRRARVLLTQD